MHIQNSIITDVPQILALYEYARNYQSTKGAVAWPQFDNTIIENEIIENCQWKLMINNDIACIWATTFTDPQIWEERNYDPSVYIHRIATHPNYKGQNLVNEIIEWAKKYATLHSKNYIRLDTVGNNIGLINYYKKCGFAFLGLFTLKTTKGLPAHYQQGPVSLFEIKL